MDRDRAISGVICLGVAITVLISYGGGAALLAMGLGGLGVLLIAVAFKGKTG